MACRIHATHSYPTEEKHAEADRQADQDVEAAQAATPDVTVEDADEWLADIDDALQENGATSELAAAFIASYVQKSGQ
jgi:hypothetical protein